MLVYSAYVSQGKVATHFGCGGKFNDRHVNYLGM